MKRLHSVLGRVAVVALALSYTGCYTAGARAIQRGRFNYGEAIGSSSNEQMLLNLVKIRYVELPVFLDLNSIVAGYTIEAAAGAAGPVGGDANNVFGLSTSARYTERPTITYTPVAGEYFNDLLLTPIPPASLLFLISAGWPPDLLLGLSVDSINGHRNRTTVGWRQFDGDATFFEVVESLQRSQREGVMGLRIEKEEDGEVGTAMFFRQRTISDDLAAQVRSVKEKLGLDEELRSYRIQYGPATGEPDRLNVLTRSVLQVMLELSAGIDIPPAHSAEGVTLPSAEGAPPPLLHIKSGRFRPSHSYCVVEYRDHYFWIDDADLQSKRAFAGMLLLYALASKARTGALPLVTIPAS